MIINLHQDCYGLLIYIFYKEFLMNSFYHTFGLRLDYYKNEDNIHASRELLVHKHVYWTIMAMYYLPSVTYLFLGAELQ